MLVISYSDAPHYKNLVDRLRERVIGWGIQFLAYDRDFLLNNVTDVPLKQVLTVGKGGGYWAWKPLIILDALKKSETVIYMDSSVIPTVFTDLKAMVAVTDKVSAIATSYVNQEWTKHECFEGMNCDSQEYWYANQVWAGVVCAKLSGSHIVREWLKYCSDSKIISDETDGENREGFKQHRHDQSILTNLLIKHHQQLYYSTHFMDVP